MEDTLRAVSKGGTAQEGTVLILIIMEDTLRVMMRIQNGMNNKRLNPYYNGRYSPRAINRQTSLSMNYIQNI